MPTSLGRWWCPALAAALIAACNETPVSLPKATNVVLSPSAVTLTPSESVKLSAQVVDQVGGVVDEAAVIWSSDNPAVAKVVDGTVSAEAIGTAQVTASYGSISAATAVTVRAPTLVISPRSLQLYPEYSQGIYGKAMGSAGQEVFPTVTWTVVDPTVVQLYQSAGSANTVVSRAQGATQIIAQAPGTADTIPVSVVRDARSLIAGISILQDAVTYDATSAAPLLVDFRAVDGYGYEECQGTYLGFRFNRSIISSATRISSACQIQITPTGQPGSGWLYASVNNVSDSILVTIAKIAYTAAFTGWPDSTRAGDTVSYGVTVLDEASQPAAGVAVNFDVSGGALSSGAATTNGAGVATVNWYLPTRTSANALIPPGGTSHAISFRMVFPSGATSTVTTRTETVVPNAAARVVLLGNFAVFATGEGPEPAVDTLGPTASVTLGLQHSSNVNLNLYAQSFDRFGNPRVSAVSFTTSSPAAIAGVDQTATSGLSAQTYTALAGNRLRTDTIYATEGVAKDTVVLSWVADPELVWMRSGTNEIWTGQPRPRTGSWGIEGDTLVYSGGVAANYPTPTMRADTFAFVFVNGSYADVGLVASDGSTAAAPVSTIPVAYRADAWWGWPGIVPSASGGAGSILFLSDRDPIKNVTTNWLYGVLSATTTGYTRTTGSFVTNGFVVGMVVYAGGFANSENNGYSKVTAVTATTLTVDKTPALVAEGPIAAGYIDSPNVWDLYLFDRRGGAPSKVTNTPPESTSIVYRGISVSSDGTKALIARQGAGTPTQVFEVRLSDGQMTALTANLDYNVYYYYPWYSPDGSGMWLDAFTPGGYALLKETGSGFQLFLAALSSFVYPTFAPGNGGILGYQSGSTFILRDLATGAEVPGRQSVNYPTWSRR